MRKKEEKEEAQQKEHTQIAREFNRATNGIGHLFAALLRLIEKCVIIDK